MHPPEVKREALRLIDEGLNDCQISRRMGVPRPTIRDWRTTRHWAKPHRSTCPRCGGLSRLIHFGVEDYAELFGLYLGDGCISRMGRTDRLRIALDKKYPGILADTHDLLARSFPANKIGTVDRGTWVDLSVYSSHLRCLLPQHGPGKKHGRAIKPELWQWAILAAAPWPFIRGCIRTDGCVFVNRTGPYEYLSYAFSNKSKDIALVLSKALDFAGVRHRLTDSGSRAIWQLRINRRADVARVYEHVGLKT